MEGVAAKKSTKLRRLRQFRIVERDADRKNPQSLRRALYEVLIELYNGDLGKAAVDLKQASKRRKQRTLKSHITANVLYDIVNDRTHIKYAHLDAFSQKLGIPTGLLLIYSRLIANNSANLNEESKRLIKALNRVLVDINTKLDNRGRIEFFIKDLERWCEYFKEETEGNQISLF